MLGYPQGEICVLRMFRRILVTVPVHRDDSIGVFIHNNTMRIHTESTHHILKLLRAVNNLAFIQFVSQRLKNLCRELNTHADIDTVRTCFDPQVFAYAFQPFAAASADRKDTVPAGINLFPDMDLISVSALGYFGNGRIEIKIDAVLQFTVQIFEDDIIDIRSEMADLGIEKMKPVFQAHPLDFCICSGIQLCPFPAMTQIDLVRGRRSTEARIRECFVTPTLTATPGDLSLVIPKGILDGIIEMIYALDKIAPGTANDDTLLYGVEVKFYNMEVEIDENLETERRGLYVIGDGSGVTHSLSHASASGVFVARRIMAV